MKAKSIAFVGLIFFSFSSVFSQSLEQSLRHLELEQYASAKNVLNSLIKKDPSNPEYNYYMGEVYLKSENSDSAKYFFNEGIKKKENYALNHAGLGKVISETNPSAGKIHLDKSLELSKSKDAKVLASVADYYINSSNKNLDQAISLLEKAIKADSKNPSHYMLMGDAYLGKNDGSQAIAYYNKGFDLNKNWPYPYLKIGKLYTLARNFNLAVEYYNKGLAIDPNYGPLHREIGEVYYKARQYNKAIVSYKKYVELSDQNLDTDLRYASFLYSNKDYTNAIAVLSELAKKEKDHLVIHRLLAYSYYEMENYDKGLTTMEGLWKNPDNKKYIASDYEYYGRLLLKANKDSLGILNLKKAVEMDTSKSDLYGEIGNIYFQAKRYTDAAREYALKVSYKPTAQDYLVLGRAYYFDKQYAQADSAFSHLIRLAPTSPTAYLWKARANAYMDEDLSKGLAKPHYEKYIELADPEKYKKELVEAYSSLGAYHMKRKDKKNADVAWSKVKELDPSNKEVDSYIKAQY